jgi:NAD(P)-dependent dehydrogenase (short-subunit alcohol dehydrogenase family)
VTRILITGSAEGLGRAAATTLLGDGHQVVVHARDTNRAAALTDLVDRGAALVVGDLASAAAHPIASFHGRVNGSARTSQRLRPAAAFACLRNSASLVRECSFE